MSGLEELILQLCPDGVEYKKLKDCTEMKRGSSATKSTLVSGDIPVISGGKEPAFYCNVANRVGETITVAGSGAGAGYVQFWDIPIFVNDAFSVKGLENVNTKYAYYVMTNLQEDIYSKRMSGDGKAENGKSLPGIGGSLYRHYGTEGRIWHIP